MKTIRLVIFNEEYWNKGLIYTQNILPLLRLSEKTQYKIEIFSFTSIIKLFSCRERIKSFKNEMSLTGVKVYDYPVLYYPTRLLIARWYILPYLFLNTFISVLLLRLFDRSKDVTYNLRSYPIALVFSKLYGKGNLIFDPRTDWIEENINSGNFKEGGINNHLWNRLEGKIAARCKKTIFISDVFKDNFAAKHPNINPNKYCILYNPIDYIKFNTKSVKHDDTVFLYTGSFGQWNKLETYLDFFKSYCNFDSKSRLIVCTSANQSKVMAIVNMVEYRCIKDKLAIFYSVSADELPKFYSMCDYGLQLMQKKDSRVGVKFIEYIAAGITPIVNSNVQGAVMLAVKYNLGIVLEENDGSEDIYFKIKSIPRINRKSESYKAIQKLTDLNCISNKLQEIYNS